MFLSIIIFVGDALNIGALTKLTGIPSDTLRTWERRYGYPKAERTESGHRRYSLETCERLLIIRRLLALGHKPSVVLRWTRAEMDAALDRASQVEASPGPVAGSQQTPDERVAICLMKIEQLAGRDLDRTLEAAWTQLGPMPMLQSVICPLLFEVGNRWASGRLGVHHEHFFATRIAHFLISKWQPLSDSTRGPAVVLAAPTGEEHVLGLHAAATALALGGARIIFLGADTPCDSLLRAAHERQAIAVALSISSAIARAPLQRYMAELSAKLPANAILVGGKGSAFLGTECTRLPQLADVHAWISSVIANSRGSQTWDA